MKFTAVIIAVATLVATGDACKCWKGNNIQFSTSHGCCNDAGGNWTGDDCAFAGTHGNLGKFNDCCVASGSVTDC